MKTSLVVIAIDSSSLERAKAFASSNNLVFSDNSNADFILAFSLSGVALLDNRAKKPVEIQVDFTAGAAAHRMKYGGGKSQSIAKAVGVTAKIKPRVLDVTAGLGKDAFVLAGLGCEVLMLERSAVAHALLEDGLLRARAYVAGKFDENDLEEQAQLRESVSRMNLIHTEALEYLQQAERESVNVIYLDPMFPERKKSAQVKKDMLAFQELIGKDEDASLLLDAAMQVAENRVVVKRPNHASLLTELKPNLQLIGKSSRFDIYTRKKL